MRYSGILNLAERLETSPRLRQVVSTALLDADVGAAFRLLSRHPDDPTHYGNAALLAGLRSEAVRLGGRSFVVTLYEEAYDYDGLTTSVCVVNSFSTAESAKHFLENYVGDYVNRISAGDVGGDRWQLVDYHPQPYRWLPNGELAGKVLAIKSLAFRACEFNSRYAHFCLSHHGGLISELIKLLGDRDDFWRYFVDCGRAAFAMRKGPR